MVAEWMDGSSHYVINVCLLHEHPRLGECSVVDSTVPVVDTHCLWLLLLPEKGVFLSCLAGFFQPPRRTAAIWRYGPSQYCSSLAQVHGLLCTRGAKGRVHCVPMYINM